MLTYEKNITTGTSREYAYLNNQIIGWKETDSSGVVSKRYAATDLLGSVTAVTDNISLTKTITQYDYNTICIRSLVHDAAYRSIILSNTYLKRRKEERGHRGEETTRRKSWFLSPNYDGMYTGKDIDSETGLTYDWNRWRSEDGSSFISEDPARDGSNWYGYCSNNPINSTDPTGLKIDWGNLDWGIINTGRNSRTGGIDINLGFASLSVGKDGIQAEVLNVSNWTSVGVAITWGGPEAERGINLNYSTLLGDTNIGIQGWSLYANTEIATFGVGFSLGKTTGVGAHWAFGEAYIGTDATVVYSTFSGGYYQDNKNGGDPVPLPGKYVRLGGKYVGPNWTANGWTGTNYYYDDWGEWPIAYIMFDHAARIHDERSNWDDAFYNNEEIFADDKLVANSWRALFFSPRASDKIKAVISIIYFTEFGSLWDWETEETKIKNMRKKK